MDANVSKTKHMNCVGSNIFGSYQDTTSLGSGLYFYNPTRKQCFCQQLSRRRLDVRAVSGSLTRDILLKLGYNCLEVYGAPAILMPLIYSPATQKKHKFVILPQFASEPSFRSIYPDEFIVSMNTNDYKYVMDKIVSSEMVYTSFFAWYHFG